jgi:hypothetical protein
VKWHAPIHAVDNYEPGDDAAIWGYIRHFTFTEFIRKQLARYSNANSYREICAIGKEALWVSFKGYLLLLEVSSIFKIRFWETLDRSQLLVSHSGRFNPGIRRIVGWFLFRSRLDILLVCWGPNSCVPLSNVSDAKLCSKKATFSLRGHGCPMWLLCSWFWI